MGKTEWELFARCASGFEDVLGQELKDLHLRRVRPLKGGVAFFGSQRDAYRACLHSRVATRIQLVLARVGAADADALYQGVHAFAWEDHLPTGATIAVDAHGTNDSLRNTKFSALKVKDALCDRMREVRGDRPVVNTHDPDFAIDVALHQKKATLYLNLSGPSLHRRGYRAPGVQTEAPLKETLAAGMLLTAGWPELARRGGVLVDPLCGSGTLAIEGALMAAGMAPGLLRERWGFEGWKLHDEDLWAQLVADAAQTAAEADLAPCVLAGDLDGAAIDIARANASRAGVSQMVRFYVDDAANLRRHLKGRYLQEDVPGLMVANPPYGQRLLSKGELSQVNAALAAATQALPSTWRLALITPDTTVDTALGRVPQRVLSCYNGPLSVSVRQYALGDDRQTCEVVSLAGTRSQVPLANKNSAQFAARLRKVAKERLRWAGKHDIECLRIYDADLPDFAVSVDLYFGAGADVGRTVAVVDELRRPRSVNEQAAAQRLADAAALVAAVFDLAPQDVLTRPYRGDFSAQRTLQVREAGCAFSLELGSHVDSRLPLDQRGLRALVAGQTQSKRFANLFDASAAASVVAARAGAASTVTVSAFAQADAWVRNAMQANGCQGKRHRFVRQDVRSWVTAQVKAGHAYDLVLCAPPAWMPAPAKGEPDWDIERDGEALVHSAAKLLSAGGTLVLFLPNDRLALGDKTLRSWGLAAQDVSADVLQPDFARPRKGQRCLLLRRE